MDNPGLTGLTAVFKAVTAPRSRKSLKILCWNINHARDKCEGAKVDIPELSELFDRQDIILLQETKEPVTMRNYFCFNSNRQNTKSGGVFIGVHKSLKSGIVKVDTGTCEDIVIVKLKANFFGLDKDLNLVNVYDSPKNGSFKKRKREEEAEDHISTLDKLQELIAKIPLAENIALLGDFNARTGSIDDSLQNHRCCDDPQDQIDLEDLPNRCNKDKKLNQNGRPFIELLQTFGLRILNGRTLGDIFGEPTCIQRNGVSTVDYICLPPNMFNRVNYFKVGRANLFSDHRPLHLSLQTKSITEHGLLNHLLERVDDAPKPYKWVRSETPDLDTSFRFIAAQNTQEHINKTSALQNLNVSCKEEVYELNEKVILLYKALADSTTTQRTGKRTNKRKWYDWSCRNAKREANRAERKVNSQPESTSLRTLLFDKRKDYRKIKRHKKNKFLYEMNEKINNGGKLDWNAFKNLTDHYKDEDSFDIYDLISFHDFFNNLYNRDCTNGPHIDPNNQSNPSPCEQGEILTAELNREISVEEISACIKKLKNNKSVSCDLISNEMLKSSGSQMLLLLHKLFNSCMQQGIYPWNCSITTPLHKKGDRQNPDNYRAITVGSCLGKLFSSILLKRLLEFRAEACPDVPNQLGFRSGAQCNDHILTLSTTIEKYLQHKRRRVFACFVDYRKAFDSVCRDALLFKLSNMGLTGNFFRCVKYMYSNSSTRIKLVKKLSAAIDVTIGTEQGHPMSPELFKIFIHDLSVQLDNIKGLDVPLIDGFKISHLLWADDLVLLALDAASLQKLLDCLSTYAEQWELSVNLGKTNVMVFNKSSRILNCAYGFKLGSQDIAPVRKYCYLGIQISLNGSFKHAIDDLRKKALRAFFSIRRTVDTRALTTSTMLKLVDSLIKPVATYGCPIWLHTTNIMKTFASANGSAPLTKTSSKDALETTHLRILKWILGIHRKSNNMFCYGDTGRLPWAVSVVPQCVEYFRRASTSNASGVNKLLHHTFQEQKNLELPWYRTWKNTTEKCSTVPTSLSPATTTFKLLSDTYIEHWKSELTSQSKMKFYCSVKNEFKEEPYLQLPNRSSRVQIAKLRSSSHDLGIERGRYTKISTSVSKACRFCCDHEQLDCLLQLPNAELPIIESEEHVLTECPGYHNIRARLSENLLNLLLLKEYSVIMHSCHLPEFGKYLTDCSNLRNPKKTLDN